MDDFTSLHFRNTEELDEELAKVVKRQLSLAGLRDEVELKEWTENGQTHWQVSDGILQAREDELTKRIENARVRLMERYQEEFLETNNRPPTANEIKAEAERRDRQYQVIVDLNLDPISRNYSIEDGWFWLAGNPKSSRFATDADTGPSQQLQQLEKLVRTLEQAMEMSAKPSIVIAQWLNNSFDDATAPSRLARDESPSEVNAQPFESKNWFSRFVREQLNSRIRAQYVVGGLSDQGIELRALIEIDPKQALLGDE